MMVLKTILSTAYAACVTYAAVYFDRPAILWWYVLLIVLNLIIE